MDARQWLDELQAALARQKLPPFYVERFVAELSDHITDSLEDRMSTDAKDLRSIVNHLGPPAAVAATAAGEFRKGRFSTRHPVVTFVVLPLVSLVVLWAAALILFVLAASVVNWFSDGSGERWPDWLVAIMPVVACVMALGPIALAATLFCRVARRAAIGWKWPLAACLLLALVGGAAFFDIKITRIDRGLLHGTKFHEANRPDLPANGHLMFGFGLNKYPRPWQLLQFSVPLAVCGLFAWRQYHHRRQHVLAG